jgi:hypothetical protein
MGYAPTKLCAEFWAAMTVHSANETTSGFGFSTGSPATDTNHIAYIYTNGTNWHIRGTPGTGAFDDAGAADDASWHKFKIVITSGGTTEWFIDGTSQGTITLVTDLYPTALAMHALTTNRPGIASGHVWYE